MLIPDFMRFIACTNRFIPFLVTCDEETKIDLPYDEL